jgi:hypothetical protein
MTDQPTEIHVSSVRATADPGPLGLAGFALKKRNRKGKRKKKNKKKMKENKKR